MKQALIKPEGVTLLAAVMLVGLAGGCLSCLKEDENSSGPPGAIDPASSGSPSGNGQPSGGGQPTGGGQPNGNQAYNPAKPSGFWANTSGNFVYIWPDGRFVVGRPVWADDGSFDEEESIRKNGADKSGRIIASRQDGGGYRHDLRFDNDKEDWASAKNAPTLYWPMRYGLPERPIYVPVWVSPVTPTNRSAISGVYVRQWSNSTPSNPGAGQYGVSIYASGLTVFDFKPGNRVYFRNNTYISTQTTVGVPGGGSTPVSAGWTDFEGTNVEGEGTYSIEGWFMKITFDNGDVLEDIFHSDGSTYVVFGNSWAKVKQ
jgi:hypothetical protein